mgnify:CR=1 FL=1|jgi:hypothetical protein
MKLFYVCFILLISFSSFSQAKKVKIKLIQYLPYCGGARPNQEANNTPNKSVVYANKKLIVLTDQNIIDTVTTDKSGYIKVTWAYGTYKLFEPWKYYQKIPSGQDVKNINMDCLKEEWKKEDLKIVVSKKTTTVANNIILIKCPYQFPCLINKHLPQ